MAPTARTSRSPRSRCCRPGLRPPGGRAARRAADGRCLRSPRCAHRQRSDLRRAATPSLPGQRISSRVDARRAAQADVRAQARRTEAAAARHGALDLALPAVGVGARARAARAPTATRFAFMPTRSQLEPVVAVPGILEQDAVELVARDRAADVWRTTSWPPLLSMSPKATAWPFCRWPKPPDVVTFWKRGRRRCETSGCGTMLVSGAAPVPR